MAGSIIDCVETNDRVDARATITKDFGLRHIGQKSASDRRVELKASSSEMWPDGEWYAPWTPDCAALSDELVFRLASTYDTFLCSIIRNSTAPGAHTSQSIVAALDLRLTNVSHHTLGRVIEQRVRSLLMKRCSEIGLLRKCAFRLQSFIEGQPGIYELGKGLLIELASGEAIVIWRNAADCAEPVALIVISGSVDAATAFEQYARSTGWLRGALAANSRCETILLSIDDTLRLERQIRDDGLLTQHRNLMQLLALPGAREGFFDNLFGPILSGT